MPDLIKLKNRIVEHNKVMKIVFLLFISPLILTVLNFLLNTLFQLGIYTGTFLRFLYSIVVY